jgi:ADP-ribose diphosphatase
MTRAAAWTGSGEDAGTSHVVFEHRYFTILRDDTGEYLASPSNVLVLACPEPNQVILIEEWSHSFGRRVLVAPGGEVEPGEDPLAAAQRELREEVGVAARQLMLLAVLDHDAKYSTRQTSVVHATDLYSAPLPGDESHPIGVRNVGMDTLASLITSGVVTDASTIAALLLLERSRS